jgi:hypothetical protein
VKKGREGEIEGKKRIRREGSVGEISTGTIKKGKKWIERKENEERK